MILTSRDDIISINIDIDNAVTFDIDLINSYTTPYIVLEKSICDKIASIVIKPYSNRPYRDEDILEKTSIHLNREALCIRDIHNRKAYYSYLNYRSSFLLSNERIIMYSDFDDEVSYYDLVRLIMAVYELEMISKGYIRTHMALLGVNQDVIAIIGDKESGKTTFLLSALEKSDIKKCLGANDKCYLKVNIDNNIVAKGSFEYIGVRSKTCTSFESLSCKSAFKTNEMYFFWPNAILNHFTASPLGVTPITQWIIPNIDFTDEVFIIESVSLTKEMINRIMFDFSDTNHMRWVVEFYFTITPSLLSLYDKSKSILIDSLAKNSYRKIKGNPYLTNSFMEALL